MSGRLRGASLLTREAVAHDFAMQLLDAILLRPDVTGELRQRTGVVGDTSMPRILGLLLDDAIGLGFEYADRLGAAAALQPSKAGGHLTSGASLDALRFVDHLMNAARERDASRRRSHGARTSRASAKGALRAGADGPTRSRPSSTGRKPTGGAKGRQRASKEASRP